MQCIWKHRSLGWILPFSIWLTHSSLAVFSYSSSRPGSYVCLGLPLYFAFFRVRINQPWHQRTPIFQRHHIVLWNSAVISVQIISHSNFPQNKQGKSTADALLFKDGVQLQRGSWYYWCPSPFSISVVSSTSTHWQSLVSLRMFMHSPMNELSAIGGGHFYMQQNNYIQHIRWNIPSHPRHVCILPRVRLHTPSCGSRSFACLKTSGDASRLLLMIHW